MIAPYRAEAARRPYDPLLDQGRSKRLSVGAIAGIVISVLVHVGLLGWLWESKFQPHYQATDEPGMKVALAPWTPPPKPPPPMHVTAMRNPPPLAPHHILTPPSVATAERAPFPPIAKKSTESLDLPQVTSPAQTTTAPPTPGTSPPVLTTADFTVRPTSDDLQGLYPETALREGKGARVQMQCVVTDRGGLTACHILSETPPGLGFGDATLKAARLFKMHPATVDGRAVEARTVFPLVWRTPSDE